MYAERSTHSAHDFLLKLIANAPFPIREIQTDNGTEFTNALLVVKAKHKTLFEAALEEMDILYRRIRIATPRHNGKVERYQRILAEELLYAHPWESEEQRTQALAVWNIHYNYCESWGGWSGTGWSEWGRSFRSGS
jgi:transposase InsO family protein